MTSEPDIYAVRYEATLGVKPDKSFYGIFGKDGILL
jgi:hypothetical protein